MSFPLKFSRFTIIPRRRPSFSSSVKARARGAALRARYTSGDIPTPSRVSIYGERITTGTTDYSPTNFCGTRLSQYRFPLRSPPLTLPDDLVICVFAISGHLRRATVAYRHCAALSRLDCCTRLRPQYDFRRSLGSGRRRPSWCSLPLTPVLPCLHLECARMPFRDLALAGTCGTTCTCFDRSNRPLPRWLRTTRRRCWLWSLLTACLCQSLYAP